jgi:hypothetical protein
VHLGADTGEGVSAESIRSRIPFCETRSSMWPATAGSGSLDFVAPLATTSASSAFESMLLAFRAAFAVWGRRHAELLSPPGNPVVTQLVSPAPKALRSQLGCLAQPSSAVERTRLRQ